LNGFFFFFFVLTFCETSLQIREQGLIRKSIQQR